MSCILKTLLGYQCFEQQAPVLQNQRTSPFFLKQSFLNPHLVELIGEDFSVDFRSVIRVGLDDEECCSVLCNLSFTSFTRDFNSSGVIAP